MSRVVRTKPDGVGNCPYQRGVWCCHPKRKYDECIYTCCPRENERAENDMGRFDFGAFRSEEPFKPIVGIEESDAHTAEG